MAFLQVYVAPTLQGSVAVAHGYGMCDVYACDQDAKR